MVAHEVTGHLGHRRLAIGFGLALCLLVAGFQTSTAQAQHAASASRLQPPTAAVAAGLVNGLPSELCGLLKKPVAAGVNYLVRILSEGRIKGSLAGTIFNTVGFQPWCKGSYGALLSRLQGVSAREPALRSRLGPFVFSARASAVPSVLYANSSFFRVTWFEYPRSTVLDRYYLWYSINGGRYQKVFNTNGIHIRHGLLVRFAVRVQNLSGTSSPWAYTPAYFT